MVSGNECALWSQICFFPSALWPQANHLSGTSFPGTQSPLLGIWVKKDADCLTQTVCKLYLLLLLHWVFCPGCLVS